MDEEIIALYAFEGMIRERGLPPADNNRREQLLAAFAQAQLPTATDLAEPNSPELRVDIWLQRRAAEQQIREHMRDELPRTAYRKELSRHPNRISAWSAWLAGYLESQQHDQPTYRDPLVIARYWLDGDQLDRASRQIRALISEPALALTSAYSEPLELFERLRIDAPYDVQADLSIVAGDLALAQGEGATAREHYGRALSLLRRDDIRRLAVFGQLMRALQLAEDVAGSSQMERYCADALADQSLPPLSAAQIRGWQAVAQSARAYQQEDELLLREAADMLTSALSTFKAVRPSDPEAMAIYQRERAFLADALAQINCELGEIALARELMTTEHDMLLGGRDQLLFARILNNLGMIGYYYEDNSSDYVRALFADSLKIRDEGGDLVGAIRSAANLVGLLGETAVSEAEWSKAIGIGDRFLLRAQVLKEVQAAYNLRSNMSEILLRQGAFVQARKLLADTPDSLLMLKLAWVEFWSGDYERCIQLLDALYADLEREGEPQDRWEWVQSTCELMLHIELSLTDKPDPPATLSARAATIISEPDPYGQTARARADSAYTHGLYHLSHSDPDTATIELKRCHEMWDKAGMTYRAACAELWLAYALHQVDEPATASAHLRASAAQLSRYGDIPILGLIAQMKRVIPNTTE